MCGLQQHINRNKQRKIIEDEDIIRQMHHRLMSYYGWIPIEEFRNTPIVVVSGLLEEIEKDLEKMNEKEGSNNKDGFDSLSRGGLSR